MIFSRLYLLAPLLPVTALIVFLKWRKKKNYFGHPLLSYLRGKLRPVSPLVYLPKVLEYLALAFLLIAVLDPVLPSPNYLVMKRGLDILLVLDLSSSMQEPIDPRAAQERWRFGIRRNEKSRLDAVKEAMARFAQRRQGDRIGVVVFSEHGYVVSPMTLDTSYLTRYLQMIDRNTLAGEGQTAIGEGILTALNLAVQQTPDHNSKGKVMIVLTDGENNTGRDPYMAIQKAIAAGFRIYYIGVALENSPESFRLIAAVKASGGNYYDVRDAEQIEKAHQGINRLEKGTFFTKGREHYLPRFYPFALSSLFLLAASISLRAIPYFIEIT